MALRIPPAANGEEHNVRRLGCFQDRNFKRVRSVDQGALRNPIPVDCYWQAHLALSTQAIPRHPALRNLHSHSIVPGGFEVTS